MSCTKHHEDITIAILVENYPKNIYGMANFEFGQNLIKTKKRKGVKLQNYHTSIVRGGKVQNKTHHADQ